MRTKNFMTRNVITDISNAEKERTMSTSQNSISCACGQFTGSMMSSRNEPNPKLRHKQKMAVWRSWFLNVNWMAAGSRLSWCIMDFFSCLQLFKHTVLNSTSLAGCRTWKRWEARAERVWPRETNPYLRERKWRAAQRLCWKNFKRITR